MLCSQIEERNLQPCAEGEADIHFTSNEADLLWLAAAYHLEQGQAEEALTYAERLMRVTPDAPRARQLVRQVGARMAPR